MASQQNVAMHMSKVSGGGCDALLEVRAGRLTSGPDFIEQDHLPCISLGLSSPIQYVSAVQLCFWSAGHMIA